VEDDGIADVGFEKGEAQATQEGGRESSLPLEGEHELLAPEWTRSGEHALGGGLLAIVGDGGNLGMVAGPLLDAGNGELKPSML